MSTRRHRDAEIRPDGTTAFPRPPTLDHAARHARVRVDANAPSAWDGCRAWVRFVLAVVLLMAASLSARALEERVATARATILIDAAREPGPRDKPPPDDRPGFKRKPRRGPGGRPRPRIRVRIAQVIPQGGHNPLNQEEPALNYDNKVFDDAEELERAAEGDDGDGGGPVGPTTLRSAPLDFVNFYFNPDTGNYALGPPGAPPVGLQMVMEVAEGPGADDIYFHAPPPFSIPTVNPAVKQVFTPQHSYIVVGNTYNIRLREDITGREWTVNMTVQYHPDDSVTVTINSVT